ncbi:MAG: peptidase M10A and M12B matrixin and adamalysin [Gammaproteobacteria bacterium]|nr:MAG: peptidase M10A and M12B matrixin and adamalysin [Gammaproteobacteria bacterium]
MSFSRLRRIQGNGLLCRYSLHGFLPPPANRPGRPGGSIAGCPPAPRFPDSGVCLKGDGHKVPNMPGSIRAIAAAILLLTSLEAPALIIRFDYGHDSAGFFTSERRNTLEQAGDWIGSHLADTLDAATYTTIQYEDPENPSGPALSSSPFTIPAGELRVFVGSALHSGSVLATGGPGTGLALPPEVFRGQPGVASGTDFAPWGGVISFDRDSSWYFDQDTTTDEPFSGFDFYSVALHELGHVIGFGTAPSWNKKVSGGSFIGAAATALYGGPVPLAGGSHWQDGLASNGLETAMDPTIAAGVRKRFTPLDLAGLQDIGWEVTAVPLPAPLFLLATLLPLLFSRRLRTA